MPIFYRPERGSFAESMAEATTAEDLKDLAAIVSRQIGQVIPTHEIRVFHVIFDTRNNWDTYDVSVVGLGHVGFTNSSLSIVAETN